MPGRTGNRNGTPRRRPTVKANLIKKPKKVGPSPFLAAFARKGGHPTSRKK